MNARECRTCGEVKVWVYSHSRYEDKLYPQKVFVDANGHEWHGKQCYECKTAEQWKWRKTRGRHETVQLTLRLAGSA